MADLKRYNIIKPGRTLRQPLDHVPINFVLEKCTKTRNESSFLQMFHETQKKRTKFTTLEIAQKYDKIQDVMEEDPSLSQMEVGVLENVRQIAIIQVLGHGGGAKPKDVRGSYSTRVELEVELNATRKRTKVLLIVWLLTKRKMKIFKITCSQFKLK
ncbi:hypothetical protein Cgig2_004331 [Carnegiea gigantea]|uniref:Uncharacterized protein n=1 Tax=Carnegiea gigantea TaxID=171969 RepID=A0A9Q1Q9B0_9CARY|nr:hypothetical protein Cgig2_004331 [Carnegiea gigantea]